MILVNDMKKMVHEVHDYSKRYKELLIKYLERGYVVNLEPVQAQVYDRSETYAEAESKPTANDMADTETLLKDFGVTGELPDFKSAFEMNRWRRKTIKSVL